MSLILRKTDIYNGRYCDAGAGGFWTQEEIMAMLEEKYGKTPGLEFGPGKITEPRKDLVTIGLNKNADYFCDIYWDLEDGIPLLSNSISYIYSNQFLEHISRKNYIFFMNEMWRVLIPGGKMHHCVPYYLSPYAWGDPTHKNFFSQESFKYFCLVDGKPFVSSFSDYGIRAGFVMTSQVITQFDITVDMLKPE